MKIRTTTAAAAAAAIVGTGAFVLPAAASASTTTHTLKFTAETKSSTAFSNSTEAEQDTDVNTAGKVVGYDMLYVAFASSTSVAINFFRGHSRLASMAAAWAAPSVVTGR